MSRLLGVLPRLVLLILTLASPATRGLNDRLRKTRLVDDLQVFCTKLALGQTSVWQLP